MQRIRNDAPDTQQWKLYRQAILISLGGNTLLALAKGVVYLLTGSSAVFADAANSLSDVFYSLMMSLGLYLAQRPPDESHPQGHRRFEPFVSLFIALGMFSAAGAALWESIQRFQAKATAIEPGWPTAVLIGAALAKVVMYLIVRRIGTQARSPAIQASARDNLSDILASSAALVGVWLSGLLHPLFDPGAGLLVSLWILRAAFGIAKENFAYLTGGGASAELCDVISQAALTITGVEEVHQVIADYVGPELRVDMHINVNGSVPLQQAHDIAEAVRERVESLPEVDRAFVYVEPSGMR
ncbi:MAG: cation transporter [Anaerolineales bacterium]|nr:cation transporter [Anaerolineales bacterium]